MDALEIPGERDWEFYRMYLIYKWVSNKSPLIKVHYNNFWSFANMHQYTFGVYLLNILIR